MRAITPIVYRYKSDNNFNSGRAKLANVLRQMLLNRSDLACIPVLGPGGLVVLPGRQPITKPKYGNPYDVDTHAFHETNIIGYAVLSAGEIRGEPIWIS